MPKPPTVFLGEMTNPEVERFLEGHEMVILPVGSLEQHGPHGPLLTDVLVPNEVARRIAPKVGALVAPPINYALSYPHAGFTGEIHIRIPTFMAFIGDVVVGLATMGFKRVVLLNGHYDNTYALAYACADVADRLPEGARAYPINYWDGLSAEESSEFFGATTGLHANQSETSAVMAINPALVDLDNANAEMPPFPEVTNAAPVHTAFFFSSPGSVYRATQSGTWGDGRGSSAEFGERFLGVVSEATIRLLDDIERTFEAMPGR